MPASATASRSEVEPSYYVAHEGTVRGPFDLGLIEAMVMCGHFPANPPVCREGTEEWVLFRTVRSRKASWHHSNRPLSWVMLLSLFSGVAFAGGMAVKHLNPPKTAPAIAAAPTPTPKATPKSRKWNMPSPRVDSSSPEPFSSQSKSDSADPFGTPARLFPGPSSTPMPEADIEEMLTDAKGRRYRVSYSDHVRLSRQYEILDKEKEELRALEAQLDSLDAELDEAKAKLNRRSKKQIDAYNKKVATINALNDQYKAKLERHNAAVDAYNADLMRVGTPID